MDLKVSHKETRLQPDGPVQVLVDNVFDLYPVHADDARFPYWGQLQGKEVEDAAHFIVDVETINDPREERLDRAMFAAVKQRGQDPVEPDDGIQYAEALIGEVPPSTIVRQVHKSVSAEGPGVRVVPGVIKSGGKESLYFKMSLTVAER
jgi:hypothetical protein